MGTRERRSVLIGKILFIKHASNEGPGLISTYFEDRNWAVELVDFSCGDTLPNTLEDIAAVVMLGGPMNVYEESRYPFLKKEDDFITRLFIEEIPFLGICLGAQLLSKACQGKVYKSNVEEIGWYKVNLTREGRQDALFSGLPDQLTVFQWHGDTFDVPEGGALLALGRTCRNQAFKVGHFAYGLQFHIEVTPDMVSDWMKGQADKVEVKKIIRRSHEKKDLLKDQAHGILSNFQNIVESSLRFKKIMKQYDEDRTWAEKRAMYWWEMS